MSEAKNIHIAALHGLAAREYMQRHFANYLVEAGYLDVRVYPYLRWAKSQAEQILHHAGKHPIVLVGFSQGGFQAVRLARQLRKRGREVALLATIATGGLGRWTPWQWGLNPRRIPDNVEQALNFFALGDRLGTDCRYKWNLAQHEDAAGKLENISFPMEDAVGHAELMRCYPQERVHPQVRTQLLERILAELEVIQQL